MANHLQPATNADADADWFFSPQAGFPQTSSLGFAALRAVIGLFLEQTVLKLKQGAETIFSRPESGADSTAQTDLNEPLTCSKKAQKGSATLLSNRHAVRSS